MEVRNNGNDFQTLNGTHYDELIGGTAVPVLTKNVTLKGVTASYKRGTLLALVNGKYEIVDSTASTGAERRRQFWHMIRT